MAHTRAHTYILYIYVCVFACLDMYVIFNSVGSMVPILVYMQGIIDRTHHWALRFCMGYIPDLVVNPLYSKTVNLVLTMSRLSRYMYYAFIKMIFQCVHSLS